MKPALFFVLASLLSFPAYAADKLVTRTVLDGKVSLLTPKNFGPMKKELLDIKYPMSRRPSEVLSDSTGGVTLAFNHTKTQMTQAQVIEAHKSISKMFHNMHPSAKWIRDETIVKDGMNFMVLELITPAMNAKIHNIMYGTSVENRFLLVAFNTTVEQSKEWLPIGKKMMSSLKINK